VDLPNREWYHKIKDKAFKAAGHTVKVSIAIRESYGNVLIELGKENGYIVVLDADLSKLTKTAGFAKHFPNRFVNVGIAEQTLMGIAAGLATVGKVSFASTFAVFATGRACEIIRNSICYPKLNVKIAATHYPVKVVKIGVQDKFGESGQPEELLVKHELTVKNIYNAAKE
jgi:transketolase C-terminal domain/subunit